MIVSVLGRALADQLYKIFYLHSRRFKPCLLSGQGGRQESVTHDSRVVLI